MASASAAALAAPAPHAVPRAADVLAAAARLAATAAGDAPLLLLQTVDGMVARALPAVAPPALWSGIAASVAAAAPGAVLLVRKISEAAAGEGGEAAAALPAPAPAAAASAPPSTPPADTVSYYGVVAQALGGGGGVEGCYVLKTVRAADATAAGGACTYFTLTRVAPGGGLDNQLTASWLV